MFHADSSSLPMNVALIQSEAPGYLQPTNNDVDLPDERRSEKFHNRHMLHS
jgi:hypothetical protein